MIRKINEAYKKYFWIVECGYHHTTLLWNGYAPFSPRKTNQREKENSVTSLQGFWCMICKVSKFLCCLLCSSVPSLFSCFPCNTDLYFAAWPLFLPLQTVLFQKALLLKRLSSAVVSIFSLQLKALCYFSQFLPSRDFYTT